MIYSYQNALLWLNMVRLCREVVSCSKCNRKPLKGFWQGTDLIWFVFKAHAGCWGDNGLSVCLPSCTAVTVLIGCLFTYTCLCPFKYQFGRSRDLVYCLTTVWLVAGIVSGPEMAPDKYLLSEWVNEWIQEQENEWCITHMNIGCKSCERKA